MPGNFDPFLVVAGTVDMGIYYIEFLIFSKIYSEHYFFSTYTCTAGYLKELIYLIT